MSNSKRIYPLSVSLANQIAAGEVIERPASVLKELLENSVDAGSNHIEIVLERGGIGLIQVQDNGSGICKEDLQLALAPHATSKILSLSDLEGVLSYGFRGEALASIGSVSRLKLSSSVVDQDCGWCIQQAGRDAVSTLTPVPKRSGTLIEVRDLFYNTPARRKFLRAEKTESLYLEEVFKRVALSQPEVAFSFQQGDREKRLPACRSVEAQIRRISTLCGKSFVQEAYYIEAESNGLQLRGWVGSPQALRAQADLQYFYVNGRIVRDKVVMHAVRQAYQEICAPGRYPAYVLYFELDPTTVDVNVHPTKHELRFRETRTVHAFLSYAVQEGLQQGQQATPRLAETQNAQGSGQSVGMKDAIVFADPAPDSHYQRSVFSKDSVFPKIESMASFKGSDIAAQKVFSLLAGNFLLCERGETVVVVDLIAARRVLLEQEFQTAYAQEGLRKRPLLMPKSVRVSKKFDSSNVSVVDWAGLGFEITEAGPQTVLVRTVPAIFGSQGQGIELFLEKLLDCADLKTCMDLMVEYVLNTQILSEAEAVQFLENIEKSDVAIENFKKTRCYTKLKVEQLRNILFLQG